MVATQAIPVNVQMPQVIEAMDSCFLVITFSLALFPVSFSVRYFRDHRVPISLIRRCR